MVVARMSPEQTSKLIWSSGRGTLRVKGEAGLVGGALLFHGEGAGSPDDQSGIRYRPVLTLG